MNLFGPVEPRPPTSDGFQARGVRQGKQFDDQCRLVLRDIGFEVGDRPFTVAELGVEFDAEIRSRTGARYWCEFKGSWHGHRPGLRRTDTVKKALSDALLAHVAAADYPPVIFLTSHLPIPGSAGHTMIEVALRSGTLFDVACVNDPVDVRRLQALAAGRPSSRRREGARLPL